MVPALARKIEPAIHDARLIERSVNIALRFGRTAVEVLSIGI